jgi:hypothetical protein
MPPAVSGAILETHVVAEILKGFWERRPLAGTGFTGVSPVVGDAAEPRRPGWQPSAAPKPPIGG